MQKELENIIEEHEDVETAFNKLGKAVDERKQISTTSEEEIEPAVDVVIEAAIVGGFDFKIKRCVWSSF